MFPMWLAVGNPGNPLGVGDPTGTTWTEGDGEDGTWSDAVWMEGRAFVSGLDIVRGQVSDDGENWSFVSMPSRPHIACAWSPELQRLVTVDVGGSCYSTDGINWSSGTGLPFGSGTWSAVVWGGGQFVAVHAGSSQAGFQAATSPDGITWTIRSTPLITGFPASGVPWRDIAYGNGTYVAVAQGNTLGGSPQIMTSPDGITWTAADSIFPNNWWTAITYGAGLFVALSCGWSNSNNGSDPLIMTSPDGFTWTARVDPIRQPWRCVRHNGERFVAVASSGGPEAADQRGMQSLDGITWTTITGMPVNSWSGVAWLGDQIIPPEPPEPIGCCPPLPQREAGDCGDTSCGRAFSETTLSWSDTVKTDGEYTFPEARLYPVETVLASLPIGRNNEEYRLTLGSVLWAPLTIAGLEWTGQYFNNTRRTL